MKAKTVNENIEFQRGISAKDSIGIGRLAKYGKNPYERESLQKFHNIIKKYNWIETGDWALEETDIKKWIKPNESNEKGQHQMTLYRTDSEELYLEFKVGGWPSYDTYLHIGEVTEEDHAIWNDTN